MDWELNPQCFQYASGDAFGYNALLSKLVNMVDGSLGVREGAWSVHKRCSFLQASTHGMVVALMIGGTFLPSFENQKFT
jgi:hypothetical protein